MEPAARSHLQYFLGAFYELLRELEKNAISPGSYLESARQKFSIAGLNVPNDIKWAGDKVAAQQSFINRRIKELELLAKELGIWLPLEGSGLDYSDWTKGLRGIVGYVLEMEGDSRTGNGRYATDDIHNSSDGGRHYSKSSTRQSYEDRYAGLRVRFPEGFTFKQLQKTFPLTSASSLRMLISKGKGDYFEDSDGRKHRGGEMVYRWARPLVTA